MKKAAFILSLAVCALWACNDNWDDYYKGSSSTGSVDTATTVLDCSLIEFFQTHDEYAEFYKLLQDVGAMSSLEADQELTVWAVDNQGVQTAMTDGSSQVDLNLDTTRVLYHVNYLSFNRNQFKDGARLKTLNGIYIQIAVDEQGEIYANDAKVVKTYRMNNGVVHVIDHMMSARMNLYAYIEQLSDEYSMYRDSIILKASVEQFSPESSTPIGVDMTGNTLYDSVFVVYNPLFDTVRINSEFQQFTCFVPSDEVIRDCYRKMNETCQAIGRQLAENPPYPDYPYLGSAELSLANEWIKRATIYNGTLSAEEASQDDIYSAYNKQWKNTDRDGNAVQVIDTENPVELSNGRVYMVQDLKIPNNVIITRLKQFLYHYGKIASADTTNLYFCIRGEVPDGLGPSVQDEVPSLVVQAGYDSPAWAEHGPYSHFEENDKGNPCYVVLHIAKDEESTEPFTLSFTPIVPTGMSSVAQYLIPAGEYNLHLGNQASGSGVGNVYFATAELGENGYPYFDPNDPNFATAPASNDCDVALKGKGYVRVGSNINFSLASPWNYDRRGGGGMAQYSSGNSRWNENGGLVGPVTVEGEPGTMQSVRIKIELTSGTRMRFFHWCLVPTENNY